VANVLHELGRQEFLNGTVNFATGFGASGGVMACLVSTAAYTTGIKQITGCTAATPAVVTATSHGFSNGDVVCISGVGGTLNANGVFVIAGVTTNTFQLTDYVTGNNVVGTGSYTSGGVAVNLGGPSGLGTYASYSAQVVGTPVLLSGATETQGTANASSITFTSVSGAVCSAIMLVATAGTTPPPASTDKVIAWIDGQQIVTAAAAISSATTLPVERLPAALASGTVLSFDDGNSATLSSSAAQYARTVTVSSATVTAGARATAPASGSGLPVTPNGGNITVTWDPNQYKIFKL
jgi:hypothetical protein